jgi:hypothetical protein
MLSGMTTVANNLPGPWAPGTPSKVIDGNLYVDSELIDFGKYPKFPLLVRLAQFGFIDGFSIGDQSMIDMTSLRPKRN